MIREILQNEIYIDACVFFTTIFLAVCILAVLTKVWVEVVKFFLNYSEFRKWKKESEE